jgi:hypothetical protein
VLKQYYNEGTHSYIWSHVKTISSGSSVALGYGRYRFDAVARSGWLITRNSNEVTLSASTAYDIKTTLSAGELPDITIKSFNDANGNKKKDSNEGYLGLSFKYQAVRQVGPSREWDYHTTYNDSDGSVTIKNVMPGSFVIKILNNPSRNYYNTTSSSISKSIYTNATVYFGYKYTRIPIADSGINTGKAVLGAAEQPKPIGVSSFYYWLVSILGF